MLRIALLVCTLLAWQAAGQAADTLVIPGTGSCEAILKELAGAFNARHPGQEVVIPPSIGSQGGLRALWSDQCIVARIVVPLDKKLDPKLDYRVFATDAVVFAVGANVEVNSLTISQLVEIFFRKNHQLAGRGRPRRPRSGDYSRPCRFHLEEHPVLF